MARSFVGTMLVPITAVLAGVEVRAQEGDAACTLAGGCEQAYTWGAWGMIALGLMFFAIGFLPAPANDEAEEPGRTRIPMLRMLQKRIEKEQTGWRRLQWPVLGAFFVGVGLVYLVQ